MSKIDVAAYALGAMSGQDVTCDCGEILDVVAYGSFCYARCSYCQRRGPCCASVTLATGYYLLGYTRVNRAFHKFKIERPVLIDPREGLMQRLADLPPLKWRPIKR